MLLGVEAPAVRPITTRPGRRQPPFGHHFVRLHRRRRADRPVPDLSRREQARRIGDVVRAHARRADPREVARCCCCCSRPTTIIRSTGSVSSSASTASCRSCVALQIVSKARKCVADRRRRSGRASPRRPSRRSPATPTSASSSGWRSRRASRSVSGLKPGETAPAKRARNASRSPPCADVVADDRRLVAIEHDEVAPLRILQRLRRRRARLFVLDLAVDDGGEAVLRVAHDVLPDVQHGPAGRVDQRAAARREVEHLLDGDAEGRQDDDVVGPELRGRARPGSLRNRMPLARSRSLTCGLWMISPVRKTLRPGKRATAW